MNGKKMKRPGKISLVLMCLLLVVLIAANCLLYANSSLVTTFLSGLETSQAGAEAAAVSAEMTQRVASEGMVLLENNGSLPLASGSKVNLFGYASNEVIYGGSGSGAGNTADNVTLPQGLTNAGFEVNQELVDFYAERAVARDSSGFSGNDYSVNEVAVSEYSDELMTNAKEFSDVAIVAISRAGGEGGDLPLDMAGYNGGDAGRHYLELQQVEQDLLAMVEEQFETVIVLINSSNAMELGFLEDGNIDAALWVGGPGETGCTAIGQLLSGEVNPSGRLPDTYAYDATSAPSYCNFGAYDYTNTTFGDGMTYHYVDYAEGIYVGYRYYETRWVDNATGACDEAAYAAAVQYPFGYGLSYTTFDKQIANFSDDGETVTMEVSVTNTGSVPGKEVVQVYYTAPYTVGGIEKSHVVLAGFGKTGLLEAGASETVTVTFTYEDMASYDYAGAKAEGGAYVLEAGDYQIKLMDNAHTLLDSRTVTVESDVIYNDAGAGARSSDLTAAVNRFDEATYTEPITYVSRADWEGTLPTGRAAASREASDEVIALLTDLHHEVDESDEPIVVADHGLSLTDMEGLAYDDPQWDLLLEQLSVEDMVNLIANGGWSTPAIASVGKPGTSEIDGPAGMNNLMNGATGNQFTSEVLMGATWDVALVEEMGQIFGAELAANNVSGVYAPAMNTHRTPFGGRNFEYVSEDSLLAGKLMAAEVRGIQSNGVYCYCKHFALNDQETYRDVGGPATWSNEQAIREIYLRPFELAVKEGGSQGIMTSYNRIGGTWTGASTALLQDVLRGEWGFVGTVVTDAATTATGMLYMDLNAAVRAGNDLMLSLLWFNPSVDLTPTTGNNTGNQALRQACKNILYTEANSRVMELAQEADQLPGWVYLLVVIDLAVVGLEVLYFVKRSKKAKAWKAAQG